MKIEYCCDDMEASIIRMRHQEFQLYEPTDAHDDRAAWAYYSHKQCPFCGSPIEIRKRGDDDQV